MKTAIIDLIRGEFGQSVVDRFSVCEEFTLDQVRNDRKSKKKQPGVYIWLDHGVPLKVGRDFVDARKRALEHYRDNTGGIRERITPDTRILLMLTDQSNLHWIAAIEVFLEIRFREENEFQGKFIPAKRIG